MERKILTEKAAVISNRQIAKGIFMLVLQTSIATLALLGQFVKLKPLKPGCTWWRPFTIFNVENGQITIVYRVVGGNTELYSRLKPLDVIQVTGPLGKPVCLDENADILLFVGGGTGVASIFPLVKAGVLLKSASTIHAMAGFKTKNEVFGIEDFTSLVSNTFSVTTDDGSYEGTGVVTALLVGTLQELSASTKVVYACGPKPMMQAVARICQQAKPAIPCWLGLETLMACCMGLGQCCAVESADHSRFIHVCIEGPWVLATEVADYAITI